MPKGCHRASPRLHQGCPKVDPRLPQGCPRAAPSATQGCRRAVPGMLVLGLPKGCPEASPGSPQGCPRATQGLPKGCLRAPAREAASGRIDAPPGREIHFPNTLSIFFPVLLKPPSSIKNGYGGILINGFWRFNKRFNKTFFCFKKLFGKWCPGLPDAT